METKTILVIGAAGYIGSTVCLRLQEAGYCVWGLDNLSTGHRFLFQGDQFFVGEAGNTTLIQSLCQKTPFAAVLHFAAKSLVSESILNPQAYWENNVVQTQNMLQTLIEQGIQNFIFSSSCAVFGDPQGQILTEDCPKQPMNPYGQTKWKIEQELEQLAAQGYLKSIALRYFNAAGAEEQLRTGEWHEPETHLIPKVLQAVQRHEPIEVYGTDYQTPDGTCVRDYIHVSDLAQAHLLAMERLFLNPNPGSFETFHLGSGHGFSVQEVIQTTEAVLQKPIAKTLLPRRAGDAPILVASSTKAQKELGWKIQYPSLTKIIQSAWDWEKKRSQWKRKAIFLDRDGTLNEDPHYLHHPDQMKLLPGVGEALALLKQEGFLLIVVSNQSGVARGLIQAEALPLIHRRLDQLLQPFGVQIHQYQLCLHHPDEACLCRKPRPKLILDSAADWNINLSKSYMIGDKASDVAAGEAAGCKRSFLIEGTSLLEIAHQILKHGGESGI